MGAPELRPAPRHRRWANRHLAGGLSARAGALFSLFFSKLSAIDIPFSAEILGRRPSGEQKNSEVLAVTPLFSAVLVRKPQESKEWHNPGDGFSSRSMIL